MPSARRAEVRDAVFLLGIGLAVHLLLPQLGEFRRSLDSLQSASALWLVAAVVAFVVSVVAGGAALRGSTALPLSSARSTGVSFTATAVGHVSPGGVAGLRLLQRYLERAGAGSEDALGAVGLVQVADVVVTAVGLVAALLVVRTGDLDPVHLPSGWIVLVGVVAALVLAGLLLRSRLGRQRLVLPARTAVRSAAVVLRSPDRARLLLGGTALQTAALALGLAACLAAFHAGAPIEHVVAAYLVATVVGTLSPTPGGIGAFEAALVATLTGLGVAAGPAVTGVLTFRLLTFWLPIPAALVAGSVLRRRRLL